MKDDNGMVKLCISLGLYALGIAFLLIILNYFVGVLAEMQAEGIGFDPMIFDGSKLGPIGLCILMPMFAILLVSSYLLRKHQKNVSNEEQSITGNNSDEKNNRGMA